MQSGTTPTDTAVHNPSCARYSCTPANACPHSPKAPWLVSSVPFYNATGPPQSGSACPSQPGSVHAGSRLLHRTLSLRADTSRCLQAWSGGTTLPCTPRRHSSRRAAPWPGPYTDNADSATRPRDAGLLPDPYTDGADPQAPPDNGRPLRPGPYTGGAPGRLFRSPAARQPILSQSEDQS